MAQPSEDLAVKPPPDFAEVPYGPHERNVLDLWLSPRTGRPSPLVLHIHGGGFSGGSKANLPATLLNLSLQAGLAVATINYRLSNVAKFPAPMHDAARALQFLRANAERWSLDPYRVAATGGSAGGGISLWLGFHEDLVDPHGSDPVARQSTRLTCIAGINTQSSYDIRWIRRNIGGSLRTDPHPALTALFGITPDEIDSPRAAAMLAEASMIDFVHAGGPPVFLWYTQDDTPITDETSHGTAIHHPRFGQLLKARLDPLGVPCTVKYGSDYPGGDAKDAKRPWVDRDIVLFFLRCFEK